MWYTVRFRQIDHPLAAVKLRSSRAVNVPGYPNVDDDSLDVTVTHEQLWQLIDGWQVMSMRRFASTYAPLMDLSDRQRMLYGLGDDSVELVNVQGLLDGEISPCVIAIPRALLEPVESAGPADLEACSRRAHARQQLRHSLFDRFFGEYYRRSSPPGTQQISSAVNTTDFNAVTGIIVDEPHAILWDIKCDGHAIRSVILRGALLDPSRDDVSWGFSEWVTARHTLHEHVHVNPAVGDKVNVPFLNSVLPDGWSVAERYAPIITEAFVPVDGPDRRLGVLVWPNSD